VQFDGWRPVAFFVPVAITLVAISTAFFFCCSLFGRSFGFRITRWFWLRSCWLSDYDFLVLNNSSDVNVASKILQHPFRVREE
jgi:hypothetical protein